ncbi:MAG: sigma 54-interacting transcriptional regulator [Vicinamibacterales bacterium]
MGDTTPFAARAYARTVVVYDGDDARRRALRNAAVAPVVFTDRIGPESDDEAHLRVGFVNLDPAGPSDAALAVIRAWTTRRVRVIAYTTGLATWTIGTRCLALLAGALALHDASAPEFVSSLWAEACQQFDVDLQARSEAADAEATCQCLGIAGVSATMRDLFRWVGRVGRLSDLHVLITGETGTGKQLFANAIHQLDPRRRGQPFLVVNCAAISPLLAESELFGHRRGAFTGADRDRRGLIRAADGGVLMLDEIGELDLGLQAKLLRVLQEGRVRTVGDEREVPVDVRVVAATNRNLAEMVAKGTFRADLFHRLDVLSVHIPPLRTRPADIAPLVSHYLERYAALCGNRVRGVDADFVAACAAAPLPGNAREVENLVRQALARRTAPGRLGLSDLPQHIWTQATAPAVAATDGGAPASTRAALLRQVLETRGWNLSKALAWCESAIVQEALVEAQGNQAKAARLLGLTPRGVYNKLRRHGLARRRA